MNSKFVFALFSVQDVSSPDFIVHLTQDFAEYLAPKYASLPADELNFLLRVGGILWRQDQEVRWKAGKRIAGGGLAQSPQVVKRPSHAHQYPVKPCSLAVPLPRINVNMREKPQVVIKGGANDPNFMLAASSAAAQERSGSLHWNGLMETANPCLSRTSKATNPEMSRQSKIASEDGRIVQGGPHDRKAIHASLLSRARDLIAESHVLITRSRNLSNQTRVF